ncbi:MAG: ABC transporter substrate-binding protein [Firmicutes bacterium]|nr:ABC transporter substrate-binding protein [Bacillota bacterium]
MKKLLLWAVLAMLVVFAMSACTRVEDVTDDNRGADTNVAVGEPEPAPAQVETEPTEEVGEEAGITAQLPTPVGANDPLASKNAVLENFPQFINRPGEHVPGTVFHYGLVTTSPFPGSFGGGLFWDATEDNIIGSLLGTTSSLFASTPYFTYGHAGVVTWEYDIDAATFTMHMQHDVYWHDGVPLTLADLVFAYEVMAHPDYVGVRFSTNERRILGIMDYNAGYVDYIAGLVLSNNDRTLTMHFDSINPAMLYFGIYSTPTPRHVFEGIAVADMPTSAPVRIHPIGWGPFKFYSQVPGESVRMVRNENFVWGTPYIEEIVVERIEPSLAPTAMATGQFDYINTFPAIHFADYQNPTNFTFIGSSNVNYSYVAFRLGHWDFDEGRNVFTPERYMNNVYLRRAMSMAINQDEIGELLFNGLHFAAGSFMPPHHGALMDTSLPGFPYNPGLANQILDEAGFTMGADGLRTWPDGSPLVVNWAHPTNEDQDHIIVPLYQQSWAAIGVNVQLWQGRTHDRNFLFDVLDYDDDNDEIHIYTASWGAGFNPNPSGRWGPYAMWNPSRYTSERFEELLANLSAPETFDPMVMRNAYFELQAYLQDVMPWFNRRWNIDLQAVNNRVSHWDTRTGTPPQQFGWHTIRLLAPEPYSR